MKLYEIGTIITGNTPSRKIKEYYESNDIMFIKPGDIEEKYITNLKKSEDYISEKARNKARILPKGTVLVTCIGTIGKVGILENEATCNQQINAIIPNDMIISKYLAYLIKSKQKILQLKANAPVVPIINKTDFSKIEINICDREEQKKIVKKLDLTKKIIDIRKKQIEELRNFIKSQFVEMFGNIYFNNRKWNKNKWGDVLIIKNGKNQKKVESFNGKYPIYGSGGIIGFANDYICNENSIIIGRKGSINKPILVKTKFWNVDTAFGLEPIKEKIKADYLYYFCCFYNFEKHNKAVTIPSLTKKDLLNIVIPVPPITLQNQFSEIVKQIDKQKFESMIQLKMLEKIYNMINDRSRYV